MFLEPFFIGIFDTITTDKLNDIEIHKEQFSHLYCFSTSMKTNTQIEVLFFFLKREHKLGEAEGERGSSAGSIPSVEPNSGLSLTTLRS